MRQTGTIASRRVAHRKARHRGGSAPGRIVKVLAVALTSFAIGAIAGRSTGPSGHDRPPVGGATAPPGSPAPRPTRSGAVSAATAFLRALRWRVLIDDQRRVGTLERFAVAGATPALDTVVSRGIGDVRRAVGAPPVVVRPVPIGYRVDRFVPPRAVVSVWGMALFGSAAYEPVSQWATSSVDLVWQEGRWKVAALRNRGGPSPRWSIEELARDAASFDEYRHVP